MGGPEADWDALILPEELLTKLLDSMERHLKAVGKAKDGIRSTRIADCVWLWWVNSGVDGSCRFQSPVTVG
jgi:hypothetical protein